MTKLAIAHLTEIIVPVNPTMLKHGLGKQIAERLVEAGYVHKAQVLDMVEVCKDCLGTKEISVDYINHVTILCPVCKGKGVTLK